MKDTWTKLFACLSLQNAILEKAMNTECIDLDRARYMQYNHGRKKLVSIALVAQWIRALACGARGRVFESRRGR